MPEHLEVNTGRKSLWMESTCHGHSVLIVFQLPKADSGAVSRKLSLVKLPPRDFSLLFYPISKLPLRMEGSQCCSEFKPVLRGSLRINQ